MAKNDVVITLTVDDKGNIKKVGNAAEKTGKKVDKLGRSTKNADRNMKGLSQQSSNSSKNFSKMAQGMSGGLVPAYATLAAQIFAVTALFRFLQQAADYRVLIEGQKAFAAETGIAYNSIARSLQKATEGQLNFKDASQAAAIASAAGINPDQLERLATGARNVSIALGRDLTDSFNRLIRGTTKAEPELLDELGIILRLDEATKKYANTLNKSKEQLTIFEKSQAVTVEVLAQVEGKFGSIGENAELQVNALNQFAKAFDDVINKIYEFVGPIAENLARFFSKNLYAFMGALTIFAIPIVKLILPSMDAWAAKTVEQAGIHKAAYVDMKADLASYQATLAQAKAGAGVNRGLFQAQAKKMGLSTSGRGKLAAIKHYELETTKIVANANYKRTGILKNAQAADVAILKKSYSRMMADTKGTTTWINRQFQTMGLKFKVVTTGMQAAWAGTMSFMKKTASKAGKFMNKAFSILMWISLLVMVWDFIKPYLGFIDKEDNYQESIEAARALNKEIKLMGDRFKEKIGTSSGNGNLADIMETMIFGGNVAQSANLESRFKEYTKAVSEGDAGAGSLKISLLKDIQQLALLDARWSKLFFNFKNNRNTTEQNSEAMKQLTKNMLSQAAAAKLLIQSQLDFSKAENDYVRSKSGGSYNNLLLSVIGRQTSASESIRLNTSMLPSLSKEQTDAENELDNMAFNATARQMMYSTGMLTDPNKGIMPGGETDEFKAREKKKANLEAIVELRGESITAINNGNIALTKELKLATDLYNMYTKFNLQNSKAIVSLNNLKAQAVGFSGRTDAEAIRARRVLAMETKSLKLAKARADLKILENIRNKTALTVKSKDAQGNEIDIVNPERQNAQAAIDVQVSTNKLLKAEKDHLVNLINPLYRIEQAATNAFGEGLQSAIMGVIDGTKSMKEGFLDMAKAVLVAIAQIIAQMIAMKALQAVGLSIPMASGGVIGGSKPKGYRSGGVVTEPTYLVGEGKYNEAVVPLPDGRSIPVMMKGGSGGNANVTVNIAADGNTTESMTSDGGQQGAKLGRAISAAVQEEMHKQQRPGGILSPYGG